MLAFSFAALCPCLGVREMEPEVGPVFRLAARGLSFI